MPSASRTAEGKRKIIKERDKTVAAKLASKKPGATAAKKKRSAEL